ncbi:MULTISPECIES: PucR family transcriptional regulator [Thermomonospora]|uniref:Putative transcriptional regulator, PucR family n=1 Tax=Thermomonospora curvata (strain ATCC 19995 / DSM 43183 / JCM 3096 / KCTC 9072 / NBRC 15933 / NCIMB 10081 / Henssen B9) TaxID=471852 RepID=D1A705_THECD|nr:MULTISPECIES: PucR family transcriptional regulator [Thermomonospora]ACY98409.1 putative transcriptional regulator, PucR family [Thermomonospora curvata DSM 43183]PKK13879.1 MAG: PucR family transcriptional regulator [Thermomonospora sp. CIF 1]
MASLHLADDRQPWRNVPRRIAEEFRPLVPTVAAEAVAAIRRQIPEYARPADPKYAEVLRDAVEKAIGHFIDLIADPDTPWDEALEFFREIGYGEAKEGRTLDPWDTALRLGARMAIRTFGEHADRLDISRQTLGHLAEAVFAYLEILSAAAVRGHTEATARAAGELHKRRRRLIELLLTGTASPQAVTDLARLAHWPVPRTLCVVAFHERGQSPFRPPALPPDVLVDIDRSDPCAIVPDPDGPGRRAMLATALRDWVAAVGPTVDPMADPSHTARSLHWAREALALARRGLLPADDLVIAADHMPVLTIMRSRELVLLVAAHRLKPLQSVRPSQRVRLARTLLECLRCGFNATEVAARLQVHPQTVRYRLHQLHDLFGDILHDPERRLELEMALHAWLARSPPHDHDEPPAPPAEADVIPLTPLR